MAALGFEEEKDGGCELKFQKLPKNVNLGQAQPAASPTPDLMNLSLCKRDTVNLQPRQPWRSDRAVVDLCLGNL